MSYPVLPPALPPEAESFRSPMPLGCPKRISLGASDMWVGVARTEISDLLKWRGISPLPGTSKANPDYATEDLVALRDRLQAEGSIEVESDDWLSLPAALALFHKLGPRPYKDNSHIVDEDDYESIKLAKEIELEIREARRYAYALGVRTKRPPAVRGVQPPKGDITFAGLDIFARTGLALTPEHRAGYIATLTAGQTWPPAADGEPAPVAASPEAPAKPARPARSK